MSSFKNVKVEWTNDDFGHVYRGKVLYRGKTPFQRMEIVHTKTFGTLLFLDGKIQISARDENRYHQYLVSAPLLAHARPKRLLVIGGGDGFSLEEAVKFPALEQILMVELDAGVVRFCAKHYPAVRKALNDPRVEVVFQDARAYLEENEEAFDVLVVDLTEPHGPSRMLYTREFYRLCVKRLRPGGILSIHTDNYFLFPESFATIYKTLKSVFPHIQTARVDMPCFGMGWTYRLASLKPISLRRMERNLQRMRRKGADFSALEPSLYAVRPTLEEQDVLRRFGRVSTDKRPFDKFAKMKRYVTH